MLRAGILGVGIAGRARAREVEAHEELELAWVHRGRHAEETGAPRVDDPGAHFADTDVVFVCSPSATHGDWTRRALRGGCHVVVEYPMARTADEAEALLAEADERGLVLHVEHIERLAATTTWMTEAAAAARSVDAVRMRFESGGAAHADGSEHAWHQLARVHRILVAHGPIDAVSVERVDGTVLDATITTSGGISVALTCRRGPERSRALTWEATLDGRVHRIHKRSASLDGEPVTLQRPAGLFARDTRWAVDRILRDASPYVASPVLLAALRVTEALGKPGVTRGIQSSS